jgi:uncharacterized membrane protein YfcA
VSAEEWVLAASAFFSGLAAGLLGMLSTIMRPMLAAMDGRDFRNPTADAPGEVCHLPDAATIVTATSHLGFSCSVLEDKRWVNIQVRWHSSCRG